MKLLMVLSVFAGLLLLGCTFPTETSPYDQKLSEADSAIEIALQKMEEGDSALLAERFSDARSRYSEAKTQLLIAKGKVSEACALAEQSQSALCSAYYSEINDCTIPLTDLMISTTHVLEDECDMSGCSNEYDCMDLIEDASTIDAKCDTSLSQYILSMCYDVN